MSKPSLSQINKQLRLEQDGLEYSISRYRKQLYGDGTKNPVPLSELPPGMALMRKAIEPMIEAVVEYKNKSPWGHGSQIRARKFFSLLTSEEIAFLTIKGIINYMATADTTQHLSSIALKIGNMLIDQYEYKTFKKQCPGLVFTIEKNIKSATAPHKHKVMTSAQHLYGIEGLQTYSKKERMIIGFRSILMFCNSTGMVKLEMVQSGKKKRKQVLTPTPEVTAWLTDAHAKQEILRPLYYPMVLPPRPWTSLDSGGFLNPTSSLRMIKVNTKGVYSKLRNRKMPEVYSAINKLQSVPWRINKNVFETMNILWERGGDICGIPDADILPLPEKPWEGREPTASELKAWKPLAAKVHSSNIRNRSKRIAMGMKIHIATKLKEEPEIYFVWYADFRGRMYPAQSTLTPQGDDSSKGLLEFANGKRLTKEGAYWLAIHGANCFGEDKITFPERYKWVVERQQDIVACAESPLDCSFWMDADDPFQFLAFCFEWKNWIDLGTEAVTHIPVSMDGSCNGLQHLSALLLDDSAPVNLKPYGKPQDIYQEVSDAVEAMVNRDADKGIAEAIIWRGKVTRKTVKRAVMTTPYGVKPYGIRTQLANDLDKIKPNYLGVEDPFEANKYFTRLLTEAIENTVRASKDVKEWTQEVAKLCSEASLPMTWTTPSGFLVIQEYPKTMEIRFEISTGLARCFLSYREHKRGTINARPMINGVSPNYIHSMDASHMMSVLNAWDKDITCVHDSIGTHATGVARLRELVSEKFVSMYDNDNPLETFRKEVTEKLPEELKMQVPELPTRGDLDINNVLNSPYFFA